MLENESLAKKREQIRDRLNSGQCRTASEVIAGYVAQRITSLTKNPQPLPFWYSSLFLILSILLFGLLTTLIGGQRPDWRAPALFIEGALYIWFLQIIVKSLLNNLFSYLRIQALDFMQSVTDLEQLDRWLISTYDFRKHLIFGISFSLIVHSIFIGLNPELIKIFGWGLITANVLLHFFHGVYIYIILTSLIWAFKGLSRYDFDIFPDDPGSSELIFQFSRILNYVVYSAIFFITVGTFIAATSSILPSGGVIISLIPMWLLAIAIFIGNNYLLSSIIIRAKWKTLNRIQAQIRALENKAEIPSQETLEHINQLIDYHNRIKATRNSMVDLFSILRIFNSLLLPTVGILLANIQAIIDILNSLNKTH